MIYNPTTIEECYEYINSINMPDMVKFIAMSEDKAVTVTHNSFGRFLRNELQLWSDGYMVKWFNERGIYHSDDMSSIIIRSYHRHMNNKEIKLSEQITHYIDYWDDFYANAPI